MINTSGSQPEGSKPSPQPPRPWHGRPSSIKAYSIVREFRGNRRKRRAVALGLRRTLSWLSPRQTACRRLPWIPLSGWFPLSAGWGTSAAASPCSGARGPCVFCSGPPDRWRQGDSAAYSLRSCGHALPPAGRRAGTRWAIYLWHPVTFIVTTHPFGSSISRGRGVSVIFLDFSPVLKCLVLQRRVVW